MEMGLLRQLALVVTLVALLTPAHSQGSPGSFPCRDTVNCSCSTTGLGYYEFLCPPSGDPSMFEYRVIDSVPYAHALLKCSPSVRASNYSQLPKLPVSNIGNKISLFSFMGCPLPDGPISDVVEHLGSSRMLKTLSFQSGSRNLSSSFRRSHLLGLESASRLVLSGNSLTNLPEDLFVDMKNLTWLNLRSNKIHLHADIFKPIPHMTLLELGSNDLHSIPDGLFAHSSQLKQLNLWKNRLSNLTVGAFEGLDSLEELDLSENQIQTLSSDVFYHLSKLKTLSLDFNNFTALPEGLFTNNAKLKLFKLNYNYFKIVQLPDKFLSNLTELEGVYCDNSNIESLSESVFWESIQIKNISLTNNLLTVIPKDLFRDQVNLLNLNLKSNKISHIPDDAFQTLTNLKLLNLDNNNLKQISGKLFQLSTSLQSLHISHNELVDVAYDAFPPNLIIDNIDLSYNNLCFMEFVSDPTLLISSDGGFHSPFRNLHRLNTLNLSHNNITKIFDDWTTVLLNLRKLDLSFNHINSLQFLELNFLSGKILVDLRNNEIAYISYERAEALVELQDSPRITDAYHSHLAPPLNIKVLIENNPIFCDCQLYHFLRYLKGDIDPRVQSMVTVEPGNAACSSPPHLAGRSLLSLNYQELLCPFDSSDSKEPPRCPKNCHCFVRVYDTTILMTCSTQNMTIPLLLPSHELMNRTELHFENSSLTSLTSLQIEANTFNKINKLYISNNNISELLPEDIPNRIEVLDLRNNHISHINTPVFEKFNTSYFKYLYLSGNPISCDCNNHPFLSFLQTNYIQVKDIKYLKCSNGDLVSSLKVGNLCGPNNLVIGLTVTIALIAFLLSLSAALYYKYQQNIKVWLFAKGWCLWLITEKEIDKDKLYDAFISFSHKDEDFVVNKLMPALENGTNRYKICIHFRDWTVGEWIPTQIAKSVQDSRRTVVVLSPNFLESVWGRMEFRTAHSRALKEGRARVIVILYGDIGPTDNLDAELQAYLSMNTYVKWGDPWFWEKLRYALPHPSLDKTVAPGMPTHCISKKNGFDDRLELIHPSTPGTPPGQNTPPAHQAHTNPLMNHVNSIPNGHSKPTNFTNGTITMNGRKINGSAKHSDV